MPSTSRIAPSTTMPPSFAAAAVVHISSPKTALVVLPQVLTTTTSPGCATSSALWIMRLSAGRALTVTASPHIGKPLRERMPASMKLKRPIASARLGEARPRKRSRRVASTRGGAASTRKPSLPDCSMERVAWRRVRLKEAPGRAARNSGRWGSAEPFTPGQGRPRTPTDRQDGLGCRAVLPQRPTPKFTATPAPTPSAGTQPRKPSERSGTAEDRSRLNVRAHGSKLDVRRYKSATYAANH